MKPAKIAVICIAALAAIGLALVVRAMGSSRAPNDGASAVVVSQPMAKVLVAAHDLEPGRRLVDADMSWKNWPVDELNPLYITDGTALPAKVEGAAAENAAVQTETKGDAVGTAMKAVAEINTPGAKADYIGAVVREPILAGEPLVARKIVRAGDSGYMAAYLEPGMRAMAISVTVETAAGGFILPGDRVDVLLTREVKSNTSEGGGPKFTTATVMRNVKVLAVDQTTRAAEDEKAVVGATATLAVTGQDAEILALAKSEGDLSLILRSYADTAGPSGHVPGVVRGGRANGGSAGGGNTVRVYREGQVETVSVP